MTNIIQQISIIISLVTNWTGVSVGDKQLGYVVTNHTAEIVYQGKTNKVELLSEPSSIAVYGNWGLVVTNTIQVEYLNLTNYWHGWDVTNAVIKNGGEVK